MSNTRIICHIVFATKHRQPTIRQAFKRDLYAYIYGIISNLKCTLIRINGITDHIHILVDLHPSQSISDFVMKIKTASSIWLKDNPNFPNFEGWADGYFAESLSFEAVSSCKQYIINQESHHAIYNFSTEVEKLTKKNGLVIYPETE